MPTFRYDKLTATSYRVLDAHTGEAYGVVVFNASFIPNTWQYRSEGRNVGRFATRDDAARALYAARHAHGFEAGAL